MRTLAAVDVGTNTVRMLVARVEGGRLRPILRLRRITGMGKALRGTGAIGEREFRDSLAALREFRRAMDKSRVDAYRACGTAALRDASNREAFLAASLAAGIRIEVVTPGDEARLTWVGATGDRRGAAGTVVMDIGGGSTELIAGPRAGDSVSLPIGVVVLLGEFRLSDPPLPWQVENLRLFLDERIRSGTRAWGRRRFRRFIGTAGTFTTLAALDLGMRRYRPERIDGYRMSLSGVRAWGDRLSRLTDSERLRLPGMERGRERYIVPGLCQALAAMERFGVNHLTISDAGLLEGILGGIAGGGGERRA